jgi:hypothetical protein
MSDIRQSADLLLIKLPVMADDIRILKIDLEDPYGFMVTFSDGTTGAYAIEELLELRSLREPVKEPVDE